MPGHRYVEEISFATILAARRSAGVTPEVKLGEHLMHNLHQAWMRLTILALKPRGDVSRSPKQGYQWLHKMIIIIIFYLRLTLQMFLLPLYVIVTKLIYCYIEVQAGFTIRLIMPGHHNGWWPLAFYWSLTSTVIYISFTYTLCILKCYLTKNGKYTNTTANKLFFVPTCTSGSLWNKIVLKQIWDNVLFPHI